jgi:hypothetical protein
MAFEKMLGKSLGRFWESLQFSLQLRPHAQTLAMVQQVHHIVILHLDCSPTEVSQEPTQSDAK